MWHTREWTFVALLYQGLIVVKNKIVALNKYPLTSQLKRGIFTSDTMAGHFQLAVRNCVGLMLITDKHTDSWPQPCICRPKSTASQNICCYQSVWKILSIRQLDRHSFFLPLPQLSLAHYCHQLQAFNSQFTFLTLVNWELILFSLYNTLCPRCSLQKATL